MTDFVQEIKRLQKLSCITLSQGEEEKLWNQLQEIIAFLGQLLGSNNHHATEGKLTLRTIKGTHPNTDTERLLKNVKHPIVNNAIVIKSVLD